MMSSSPAIAAKILVVEDSTDLVAVWKILFRKAGFEALFCTTGQAAVSLIDQGFEADIVMTDYYLPDITGLELIDEIKKRRHNVRFVIVTGNKEGTFIEDVTHRQEVTLLFKPVKFDVLASTLSSCARPSLA